MRIGHLRGICPAKAPSSHYPTMAEAKEPTTTQIAAQSPSGRTMIRIKSAPRSSRARRTTFPSGWTGCCLRQSAKRGVSTELLRFTSFFVMAVEFRARADRPKSDISRARARPGSQRDVTGDGLRSAWSAAARYGPRRSRIQPAELSSSSQAYSKPSGSVRAEPGHG
jgi:hypothetical protein